MKYTYCITLLFLTSPDQYSDLLRKIRSFQHYLELTDQSWLVVSDLNVTDFRDELLASIDANDQLVIFSVGISNASWGLDERMKGWLHKHWHPQVMGIAR